MSYSSVYTNANGAVIPSNNVGADILKQSSSNGGNLPIAPATLVSGNTYTFCSLPFPLGTGGIYAIEMNFDITGDNTTAFSYIKTALLVGGGGVRDNDFFVKTTLPDATAISTSYTTLYQTGYNQANAILSITFTPTFAGTAPTITSPYLKFYKLT